MSERVGHLSASSIAAFKACPTRYRIGYVEAIRQAQEPQPLRMGTAWHKGLEILSMPAGTQYIAHYNAPGGVVIDEENRLAVAVEAACDVYTQVPDWADVTEWAVEREIIANALAAYLWLYPAGMSEYETVATELSFDLPLTNPETGHPTQNFRRVGKIDRIIRSKATGALLIQENKSTSKPIDSGSTYWQRLRKDTQSKFYIQAARDLQAKEQTEGAQEIGDLVSGLLHDVFHKPTIKPSKLTQAESAEFIKTGDYCGQHFTLTPGVNASGVQVDGIEPEAEPGAPAKPTKANPNPEPKFALRETPAMFGARLLQDITQRPEFYFARREIAFTDQELLDFQYQIWSLQRTMSEMERTGHWYENEQNCEATFRCPFCSICYNNIQCFDGTTTPPGFRRLRVEVAEQTETAVDA